MPLSLPEQVVFIAHSPSGDLRTESVLARASTVAAAVAELRRAGRVDLDPDNNMLDVRDATPIGSEIADRVLERIVQGPPAMAYKWLELLSFDIFDAVKAELGVTDQGMRAGLPDHQTFIADLREKMRHAIEADDLDSEVIALGVVLWGGTLLDEVLGIHAPIDQNRLAHHAAQDWLGMAIRNVAGDYTRFYGPLTS
jgi:hypothetical protein